MALNSLATTRLMICNTVIQIHRGILVKLYIIRNWFKNELIVVLAPTFFNFFLSIIPMITF